MKMMIFKKIQNVNKSRNTYFFNKISFDFELEEPSVWGLFEMGPSIKLQRPGVLRNTQNILVSGL